MPISPTSVVLDMLLKFAIKKDITSSDQWPIHRCRECLRAWHGTRADHPQRADCAVSRALGEVNER